jgi:VCBS repeat-containing protein
MATSSSKSSSKSTATKVVARDNQASATEEGVGAGSNGAGNVLGNDYSTTGGLTVSGIRAGSVSSTGAAGAVGVAFKGLYGSITINANGTYTYVVDNANAVVNALAKGESLQETFTYTATNGTASAQAAIVVKVNGANDAATITGVASGAVIEDGASAVASGKLTVSDVDRGENVVKATTQSGEYGKFSIAADGTWTYVLNNKSDDVQSLAQGEIVTEKFVVTSKDGTASQTVVVTVTGTNDVPKIEGSNRATLWT